MRLVWDEGLRWREGELLVFDDSFEHEVWNRSQEDRLVFILDIRHPDIDQEPPNKLP
jgi:aspartate beta-hydroxylase